jgi:hypothetical protein
MKSVMQEASSIAKAIEQAWIKAGQPIEFSIKILEEPQRNFIGFTMRSAKIALFFDMHPTAKAPAPKVKPSAPPLVKTQTAKASEAAKPQAQQERTKPLAQPKKREYKPQWNDAMLNCVKGWVEQTLSIMNLKHVNFKIEPSDFYLRITFDSDLLPDQGKEKKLFASFATLIIETLKKTFKMSLRGHKIVLVHASHDSQSR